MSTAPVNSKMLATMRACLMVKARAPTDGLNVLATSCMCQVAQAKQTSTEGNGMQDKVEGQAAARWATGATVHQAARGSAWVQAMPELWHRKLGSGS